LPDCERVYAIGKARYQPQPRRCLRVKKLQLPIKFGAARLLDVLEHIRQLPVNAGEVLVLQPRRAVTGDADDKGENRLRDGHEVS
jgi:hypothetical protein